MLYGTASGLSATGDQFWYQGSPGIEGSVESDRFGYALAAGDFDNDGRDDLAAGSPYESVGSLVSAGAVNVIYGSFFGLNASGSQIWHQDIAGVLDVAEVYDYFGFALAAGDFDLDGEFDLAIGVPYENLGGVTNTGAVNVLYGTNGTGLTATGDQLWWQGTTDVPGAEESYDSFGLALAAGDFGSSFADALAIGVPYEDVTDISNAGAVNVIYGASGTGLNTSSQSPQIFYQGYDLARTASVVAEKGEEDVVALEGEEAPEAADAPEETATALPEAVALHAAYPNPAREHATLSFALPEPGSVRLVVYDALGREVARLVDETREAGEHAVTLEAAQLPSGTYVVRLQAGGVVQTQRLTLVR